MLIDIHTLAEECAFKAVLDNATGFTPYGELNLTGPNIRPEDANEARIRAVKDKRIILFVHHLFKPFEHLPNGRPYDEEDRERIESKYILAGLKNLKWILRGGIPFILADTPETAAELETLRSYSPPLYDKLDSNRLELTKGGHLDTEALSRMGASNPDKDRYGEQTLYGDLVDWIRDIVDWKDHDLAVRLIGEYAIRGNWNGEGLVRH